MHSLPHFSIGRSACSSTRHWCADLVAEFVAGGVPGNHRLLCLAIDCLADEIKMPFAFWLAEVELHDSGPAQVVHVAHEQALSLQKARRAVWVLEKRPVIAPQLSLSPSHEPMTTALPTPMP